MPKNATKPIWNQCFWCFGTSQIIKIIKKALHQCKKTLCHKPRFSTVLKASKLMILMNAKNVIKPVWNQGFWCFGTSQIIKIIKKALHQCKKVPPDKSRFSTVLKASKLMSLKREYFDQTRYLTLKLGWSLSLPNLLIYSYNTKFAEKNNIEDYFLQFL